MPYIITTSHGCGYCQRCGYGGGSSPECLHPQATRAAVATLEEARELAYDRIVHTPEYTRVTGFPTLEWTHARLPEAGGTVGPLPDGTVIEVRPASWADLDTATPRARRVPEYVPFPDRHAAILAAFNGTGEPSAHDWTCPTCGQDVDMHPPAGCPGAA